MNQQNVRMFGLLLLPYGVVALSALGSAVGSDAQWSGSSRPDAAQHQRLAHPCLQASLDPSEPARLARAQSSRQDPAARSQSPTWARQARAGQEACLRGAP